MSYFRKAYIPLAQRVSPQEQRTLERSICETLATTAPAETFVAELEQGLLTEARRQYHYPLYSWRWLGVAGLVGGGLLSIVGGMWMWLHWRERHSALAAPVAAGTLASF